jgi:hypothetical protein
MVVTVLMISCQVSTVPIRKYDGAHTSTSSTQMAKNHARDANLDAAPANRSNNPTLGDTSDGMCAVLPLPVTVLVIPDLLLRRLAGTRDHAACRPVRPVPRAPVG